MFLFLRLKYEYSIFNDTSFMGKGENSKNVFYIEIAEIKIDFFLCVGFVVCFHVLRRKISAKFWTFGYS